MEKNSRLSYLDMVKGIAIILVVVGHSTVASDGLLDWIFSFHMPLFFIVSGILLYKKKAWTGDFKEFAKKKTRSLMVPYLTFSIIYIGIFYYYEYFYPGLLGPDFMEKTYIQFSSLFGISVLWFLPSAFLGELLFCFIMKRFPRYVAPVLCILFAYLPSWLQVPIDRFMPEEAPLVLLWMRYFLYGLLRALIATSFIGIGYALPYLFDKFTMRKGQPKASIEVLLGLGFMLLNAAGVYGNERIDIHTLHLGNVTLFFVSAVSATIGLILLCKHIPNVWLISFFGTHSLIVMLTHLDCQVMSNAIWFATVLNKYITRAKDYFFYFNMGIFLLCAELILIVVINKWLFVLIGKKAPVKMQVPKWLRRHGLKIVK